MYYSKDIVIIFNLKGNHNNGTGKIVAGRIVIIFNLKGNFLEITNVFVIFETQIRANVLQLLSGIYK